ncbi:hypothetical protein L3Q82_008516, partial [Scortum barcoo]
MDIDTVKSYKYLGVHLNDNLDWSDNTNALVKKGNSRLFLLRRLRSFGVQGPLLRTFYDSVVASAIFYGIVCWASSITGQGQEENGQTGEEGQLCPRDAPWTQWRWTALTALGSSFSERLLHPRCVKERSEPDISLGFLASLSCVASPWMIRLRWGDGTGRSLITEADSRDSSDVDVKAPATRKIG